MIQAIVYTSNTGSTAQYAELLAKETGLPVFSAAQARGKLPGQAEILYLGWIAAGTIQGYRAAAGRFHIAAVCAVGMGRSGSQLDELRQKNHLSSDMPLFSLQGGFELQKLRGPYRWMMNLMVKTAGKALARKPDRTEEEDDMLDMMLHGDSRVSPEHLRPVLDWYRAQI